MPYCSAIRNESGSLTLRYDYGHDSGCASAQNDTVVSKACHPEQSEGSSSASISGEVPASAAVPAAVERYGSIIFETRPVHDGDAFSRRHPRMTRLNRAKLFAPFAALVGFEERVQGKQAQYVPRHELDADEEWALNRALRRLADDARLPLPDRPRVRVEYFEICADPENEAYQRKGTYHTADGVPLRVDPHGQRLSLLCGADTRVLPFADIYRICDPAG